MTEGKTELFLKKDSDTIKWVLKEMVKSHFYRIEGLCHDCQKEMFIELERDDENNVKCDGGAIWYKDSNRKQKVFIKCLSCFEKDSHLRNYQECEVYSRVVGYLRPVDQWNLGKQSEWKERKPFIVKENIDVL